MKILIVGCNGQLGHDTMAEAKRLGHDAIGLDMPAIDITNEALSQNIVREHAPQLIINCAACTAVDLCETKRELAFAVNRDGVAILARCAQEASASLVHISTDYVFDGAKRTPYMEDDPPNPLSVYGASKLAGETALGAVNGRHYVFRTAWLYGVAGKNFVKSMRALALQRAKNATALRVVDDQIGSPTYSADLARQIFAVVNAEAFGLYHCVNQGACSRYELACHIVKTCGISVQVEPCKSAEFPLPAQRPPYSVLENRRLKDLGLDQMPHWTEGFASFLADERCFLAATKSTIPA
jgi:dTDP-4-dehydrorhamnose reductase